MEKSVLSLLQAHGFPFFLFHNLAVQVFPHRFDQTFLILPYYFDFFFWQFSKLTNGVNMTSCVQKCLRYKVNGSSRSRTSRYHRDSSDVSSSVGHSGEAADLEQQVYLCKGLMTHSAVGFSWMRSFIYVSPSRHLSSGGRRTKRRKERHDVVTTQLDH